MRSSIHRLFAAILAALPALAFAADDVPEALAVYRGQLTMLRQEFRTIERPDIRFFLFGMGARRKLLYRDGTLRDARSGAIVKSWAITRDTIIPNEYRVELADGGVAIFEDEAGVFISEHGRPTLVEGTATPVKLPRFTGHSFGEVLRVLHHEVLVNIVDGKPVPNFFVYSKPWLRDGAMMAMVLDKTGNLDLIRDWARGLDDPFDRNNAGQTEPDNLGQALYIIGKCGITNQPLIPKILKVAKDFEVQQGGRLFLHGKSDFHFTPVYQTQWIKLGLQTLGLPDPYSLPEADDNYAPLAWWADRRVAGKSDAGANAKSVDSYPYLGWASDHFNGLHRSPLSNRDYPLTWETHASQARYEGMRPIAPAFVTLRTCAPHTWHSAEMFLLLLERR